MTTDEEVGKAADGAKGTTTRDEPRVAAWEYRMQWPLVAAAVAFLVAYTWHVLAPDMSSGRALGVNALMWAIWALFALDYVVRLALAQRKLRFVRRNVLDLVVVVLPVFRQLRLLRIVTVLTALNRAASGSVRRNVGIYTGGSALLLGYCAALAVLETERGAPGASITTFPNALWWTITTMTTVGYGDYAPVTARGKVIAAGLMLGGIALLGVVTASIASWFVEHIQGAEESRKESRLQEKAVLEELHAVRAELAELRATLTDTRSTDDAGATATHEHVGERSSQSLE
ncbi:voltage-gated potassium channel [Saccharopolyspora lacisalsi]|uniref:Voltage-gated potassium channel n=1 Tax=Halosaccharopolyspora lacisalsi TaxID=1000566 RepID=A0A839DU23_9PSEU|nr:ion channel [Halosaccharopolyspora lacisalsi]MBA8825482.1 voltage-gated potassium channel [Halosaccharopolyspora lacisalsi]